MVNTEEQNNNLEYINQQDDDSRKNAKQRWTPPDFPNVLKVFFAFLANFITSLNFAAGVIAIVLVAVRPLDPIYVIWACKLILLGIIFDFSDGIPARLAKKKPGFFGTVIDSIADAITFGIAPAVLISLSLPIIGAQGINLALVICSIIVGCYFGLCTILRLIRFTKSPSKKWFLGIPSPGAGSAAASFIIIKLYLEVVLGIDSIIPTIIGLILMIVTATMMIVNIKYPTTKLRKNLLEIFLLGFAAIAIVAVVATPLTYIIYPVTLMGGLTFFYILYGPFYILKHMMERTKEVDY